MTLSLGARPDPGTTDLLEVLDRALAGGIVIASDRRINVVGLARPTYPARIVIAAAEVYLRHAEAEPGIHPAAPATNHGAAREPARRHG